MARKRRLKKSEHLALTGRDTLGTKKGVFASKRTLAKAHSPGKRGGVSDDCMGKASKGSAVYGYLRTVNLAPKLSADVQVVLPQNGDAWKRSPVRYSGNLSRIKNKRG